MINLINQGSFISMLNWFKIEKLESLSWQTKLTGGETGEDIGRNCEQINSGIFRQFIVMISGESYNFLVQHVKLMHFPRIKTFPSSFGPKILFIITSGLEQSRSQIIFKIHFSFPGSVGRHEGPGVVADGAGGSGHAVRGREERKNLLPGLL